MPYTARLLWPTISASSWLYYKNLSRCTVTWTSKINVQMVMQKGPVLNCPTWEWNGQKRRKLWTPLPTMAVVYVDVGTIWSTAIIQRKCFVVIIACRCACVNSQLFWWFLRVRRIAKSDFYVASSCMSVLVSVRMEQIGCHWTDILELWYLSVFFFFESTSRKFKIH